MSENSGSKPVNRGHKRSALEASAVDAVILDADRVNRDNERRARDAEKHREFYRRESEEAKQRRRKRDAARHRVAYHRKRAKMIEWTTGVDAQQVYALMVQDPSLGLPPESALQPIEDISEEELRKKYPYSIPKDGGRTSRGGISVAAALASAEKNDTDPLSQLRAIQQAAEAAAANGQNAESTDSALARGSFAKSGGEMDDDLLRDISEMASAGYEDDYASSLQSLPLDHQSVTAVGPKKGNIAKSSNRNKRNGGTKDHLKTEFDVEVASEDIPQQQTGHGLGNTPEESSRNLENQSRIDKRRNASSEYHDQRRPKQPAGMTSVAHLKVEQQGEEGNLAAAALDVSDFSSDSEEHQV